MGVVRWPAENFTIREVSPKEGAWQEPIEGR